MDPAVGLAIDTLGALLMGALAFGVWRVRPTSPVNRTLAGLVAALALYVVLQNIGWHIFFTVGPESSARAIPTWMALLFALLAAGLMVRFARIFPFGQQIRTESPVHYVPTALAVLYLAGVASFIINAPPGAVAVAWATGAISSLLGISVLIAGTIFLVARLALTFRFHLTHDRLRWQSAAVTVALALFPMYAAGTGAIGPSSVTVPPYIVAISVLCVVSLMLVWVWAARDAPGFGRAVGWSLGAAFVAGAAAASIFGLETAINSGAIGGLRVAGTVLLAYAIVRHQLFDIDLKIKWGISRGTTAGIFVAVFFVVSEGAEQVFSTALPGLWGIVAAGLLVFAVSPLQRLGERVADAAMPHVKDDPEYRLVRKREVYQAALLSAVSDGRVTDRERSVLATLADELGISATEALELERAAKRG